MRIALVAPLVTVIREPLSGGAQAVVADLATGLSERGHDVRVYAASGSGLPGAEVVDTGIDCRSLAATLVRPGRDGGGMARGDAGGGDGARAAGEAFAHVYSLVRETGVDVVHNHAFDAPAVALAAGCAPVVVHTLHLPPDTAVARAVAQARASPSPPTVVGVSAAHLRSWSRAAPLDGAVPNGVPTGRIPWSDAGGQGAVFAGRLSPEKGAPDAVAIARRAGVPLDLYGGAYDEEHASQDVAPLAATPGVHLHPALDRPALWERMSGARALLCPSLWEEPFGLVAAEAQAAGTPVVGYRAGGLPEVVVDGVTGHLVDRGDREAAGRALAGVARIDRSACRRHAVAALDLTGMLDAYEALYEGEPPPLVGRH